MFKWFLFAFAAPKGGGGERQDPVVGKGQPERRHEATRAINPAAMRNLSEDGWLKHLLCTSARVAKSSLLSSSCQ
jgi:hypothetical protein